MPKRLMFLLFASAKIWHQCIGERITSSELCHPSSFGNLSTFGKPHIYSCEHPELFDIYEYNTTLWVHFDATCKPPLVRQISLPGTIFTRRQCNVRKLVISIDYSIVDGVTTIPSTFLDGVRSTLVELQLIAFRGLQYIESGSFKDLRNINCIYIGGAE